MSTEKHHIMIVDDEAAIRDLLTMNLELVGYRCSQAGDALTALKMIAADAPDLILLDVMLPYMDGFQFIENKECADIPVIFVTARDNLSDKVKGLKLGAYDYVVKPFDTIELLARVEAVLRRTKPARRVFRAGDTTIDLDGRAVQVGEDEVTLTKREFELLEVLVNNRNIALSREKLLDMVWGYDFYGDTRTVDVHITKLRKKLKWEDVIKTVYKMGYRLEA